MRDTFQPDPTLPRAMAVAGVLGMVTVTVLILIADVVVPDHDWVADTISDLAAGRMELLLDSGLYAFSAGLIALALGAAHVHPGDRGWRWGTVGVALLGLVVFLIGARDEYGDGDSESVVIHLWLVGALYGLMAAVPWAMSGGASAIRPGLGRGLLILSLVWIPVAPVFFVMPDGWDGLYERGLAGLMFVLVALLAATLWLAARRMDRP